jgi:hypothetical protein
MAQRSQNKMLRILDGALVSERKSTKTLLDNQNMLSVNQIAAQIKLTEMWKASNDPQKKDKKMPLKQEVLLKETLQKLEDQQKQKRVLHVMLLKYGTKHLRK